MEKLASRALLKTITILFLIFVIFTCLVNCGRRTSSVSLQHPVASSRQVRSIEVEVLAAPFQDFCWSILSFIGENLKTIQTSILNAIMFILVGTFNGIWAILGVDAILMWFRQCLIPRLLVIIVPSISGLIVPQC
ncbi:uncharacterized protein LOC115879358 [Sitophilus oryzae]|uniref:Uncharacterized protein LOC115879358 n=1 Tax=Sitophilus oryzae TaxID=7048 RepID=A0A6J2XLQ2_SITOR|nr:uncharacterized protein LOC115879358 [Sitophilus oryzae]